MATPDRYATSGPREAQAPPRGRDEAAVVGCAGRAMSLEPGREQAPPKRFADPTFGPVVRGQPERCTPYVPNHVGFHRRPHRAPVAIGGTQGSVAPAGPLAKPAQKADARGHAAGTPPGGGPARQRLEAVLRCQGPLCLSADPGVTACDCAHGAHGARCRSQMEQAGLPRWGGRRAAGDVTGRHGGWLHRGAKGQSRRCHGCGAAPHGSAMGAVALTPTPMAWRRPARRRPHRCRVSWRAWQLLARRLAVECSGPWASSRPRNRGPMAPNREPRRRWPAQPVCRAALITPKLTCLGISDLSVLELRGGYRDTYEAVVQRVGGRWVGPGRMRHLSHRN